MYTAEKEQQEAITGVAKTLYSLMLNDEVVREVDRMAHRLGTSRSALINEILAEHVNYTTPEKRINEILSAVQELVLPAGDLIPFLSPNACSMSLKSSLAVRYRPTVRYEVELFRGTEDQIGELSVMFRSQSPTLIAGMTDFFRLWAQTEEKYLCPGLGENIVYALSDGKLTRSLCRPKKECTGNELAAALAEYIRLFDRLLKAWLSGEADAGEIEAACRAHIRTADILF